MEPVAKTSLFPAYVFQFTGKTFIFYYFHLILNEKEKNLSAKPILKVVISNKLLIKKELILRQ